MFGVLRFVFPLTLRSPPSLIVGQDNDNVWLLGESDRRGT